MTKIFHNRAEAGQLLAKQLLPWMGRKDVSVLALPRGGVPVGYEIARTLKLPLDVFLVRKLGVPGQEELAFGAIALGNVQVFNDTIIDALQLTPDQIQAVIAQEQQILNERNQKYRGNRPLPNLHHQTVILVDDGIATGATMHAAIQAIRQLGCADIRVAVPVAPPEVCEQFNHLVEGVICLLKPTIFMAIGNWYENFPQISDEEVYRLLKS